MLALAALLAAKTIAVVPVAGANVTAAELAGLAPVDDAVRAAVAADGFTLQAKEQTSAALASARAAGVVCAVADEACWKKAAALCDVELLLVPSATLRPDGDVVLVLTLVDGGRDAQRVAAVVGRTKDDGRTKKLVDDALVRLDAPTLVDADTPAPEPPPAPTPAPTPPPKPALDTASIVVGGAVGAGAVVGVMVAAVTSWLVIAAPPRQHAP